MMKKSIKEYLAPLTISDAEIVSDRIMTSNDEVVLRNREDYVLYNENNEIVSVLNAETGFKNCKTNSKTISEAQLCFIYIANLEFSRYSKKEYPIYKIINTPVFDGYEEGKKFYIEEHTYDDVLVDEEDDLDDLEELDI